MATPKPELALDVLDIEIGIASQDAISGLAFRFHLRDGSTMVFALPAEAASRFANKIQERLAQMQKPAGRPQ